MAQRSRPTVAGVMADAPPRIKQALLDDPRTDNDTGHHPTPPASQTPAQAQAPIAHSGQDIPVPASTTKPKSTAQISAAACPVRVKWDWGPVRQPGSAARVNSEAGRGHGRAVERHFGVRLAFQNSPPASRRPCRAWLYYPRAGLPARRITCAPVGYQQAARPSGRATPRRESRTSYASVLDSPAAATRTTHSPHSYPPRFAPAPSASNGTGPATGKEGRWHFAPLRRGAMAHRPPSRRGGRAGRATGRDGRPGGTGDRAGRATGRDGRPGGTGRSFWGGVGTLGIYSIIRCVTPR